MAADLRVIKQTTQQALEAELEIVHDQLAGAEREIRGWRTRYANLVRDRQAEAEADQLWPLAVRLFAYWKRCSGHTRAEWTAGRFDLVRTLLSKPDGLERALRAISGTLSDEWRVEKGLTMFEDIFESQKKLERAIAKCPAGWKPPPATPKGP